ncbi:MULTISPECIES: hypothetical protein [unclassified Moraxella]|uniref:HD domain-containing protein n=1 Tax=unclassified Moraxella TaxID=2685852 RepID=UPI003AF53D95
MQSVLDNLLNQLAIPPHKISDCWHNLTQHYDELHRHYHNLTHIQALLSHFERIKPQLAQPSVVLLAIFYHDVIYQTQGKNPSSNERQSADFFIHELGECLPNDVVNRVVDFIMATEKHEMADKTDSDMAYFLDMDLSILGQSEAIYQAYAQAIRLEYQHVPKFLYNFSRKKALKHFLNRERLYFTDDFVEKFEGQARENIANEINQLKLW